MIVPIVRSGRGVCVIGGGEVHADEMAQALQVAPCLVAADGGADQALKMGYRPDWVIGDLDSIGVDTLAEIPPGRLIRVEEQDSTDFTKCLQRIEAPFICAAGFTGLRLDHTLAALSAMAADGYPPVILLASDDIIFLAPAQLSLPLAPGTRVSLYPLGPAQGQSTGLEWPIDGIEFAPTSRIGTSNRATGPIEIRIQGKMLVLLPRACFQAALSALQLTAR